MGLLDALGDIFQLLQSQIIDIPLNNGLAVFYVVINFVAQIAAIILGGEVDIGGGNGGF